MYSQGSYQGALPFFLAYLTLLKHFVLEISASRATWASAEWTDHRTALAQGWLSEDVKRVIDLLRVRSMLVLVVPGEWSSVHQVCKLTDTLIRAK